MPNHFIFEWLHIMKLELIVLVAVIVGALALSQWYTTTEGFDRCAGLDEQNCRMGCGWCVDDNGYGSCKSHADSKCAEWSRTGSPVVVAPPSYFYYPSYWWGGPGGQRSGDWRRARQRRRRGGW